MLLGYRAKRHLNSSSSSLKNCKSLLPMTFLGFSSLKIVDLVTNNFPLDVSNSNCVHTGLLPVSPKEKSQT